MKIIFIPYRRLSKICFILGTIFLLLTISLGLGGTISVLNDLIDDPIYKGTESQKKVAFECNVVWGTEYVPLMLDIFNKENIQITFFIGGDWAAENPDLLKKIVSLGHELGNHGYYHKHHNELDLNANRKEIIDTENVIKQITGIQTKLFAPPYGEFNKTTLKAASSLGYKTIMWSIDTIDWRGDGVDKVILRVLKKPHNGAFILMHPTNDTIVALPVIINELKNQGFEIGKVSDLLEK